MNDKSPQSDRGLGEPQLDRLLSEAARRPIALPPRLGQRIEMSVRRAERRRRIFAGTFAAAAAVIAAAVTLRIVTIPGPIPPSDLPIAGPVIPPDSHPAPPSPASIAVIVRPDDDANVIALPIETRNPNITIVWLYPTVQTAAATAESTGEQVP